MWKASAHTFSGRRTWMWMRAPGRRTWICVPGKRTWICVPGRRTLICRHLNLCAGQKDVKVCSWQNIVNECAWQKDVNVCVWQKDVNECAWQKDVYASLFWTPRKWIWMTKNVLPMLVNEIECLKIKNNQGNDSAQIISWIRVRICKFQCSFDNNYWENL